MREGLSLGTRYMFDGRATTKTEAAQQKGRYYDDDDEIKKNNKIRSFCREDNIL